MKNKKRMLMSVAEEIYSDIMRLKSIDKLQLVDKILASIDTIDKKVEQAWSQEAEARIKAYENNTISTVPADSVFGKYIR